MMRSVTTTQSVSRYAEGITTDAWSRGVEQPTPHLNATNDGKVRTNPPRHARYGPLVTKVRNFSALSGDEIGVLESLCRNQRLYEAEQTLFQEGSRPGHVCFVISGLAYSYKMLPCGHRQILGYLVPGDMCDLGFLLLDKADYSVSVVVESRIAKLPIARLAEVISANPNVRSALDLAAHLDHVILREWLLNVGQRKAHHKLSHFVCEIAERFQLNGEVSDDGSFAFPFSQSMLADTIGTTPVHVNRMLQRLRQEGLITLGRRRLRILDKPKLAALANFQGDYLKFSDLRRV